MPPPVVLRGGAMKRHLHHNNKNNKTKSYFTTILTHGLVGIICFYLGLFVVTFQQSSSSSCSTNTLDAKQPECPSCPKCPLCVSSSSNNKEDEEFEAVARGAELKFPNSLTNFVHDYAIVPRDDMNRLLEVGVPLDDPKPGYHDALILYPTEKTLPSSTKRTGSGKKIMNATQATENCMSVKVVLQDAKPQMKQCFVIMPQWESYHVHKFMRLPTKETRVQGRLAGESERTLPLRYVSQSHNDKGSYVGVPEQSVHTIPYYKTLIEYYQNLERIKSEIKPILDSLNSSTIIVLVCNYGQSELLHNFVCNAKAKGLDVSQIFVFCTDEKTYTLATKTLNLAAYYDESIFGDMPEKAAGAYGDRTFAKMMMAKVYCVHLVLVSGYSVLFQDVDVIWYKHPLPYFDQNNPDTKEWDMMFQDDGSRQARYTPYSPNTGFYFVRHSHKTVYLFEMLLRHGDYILKVKSHQAALVAVMNEHISWKGIRVKTFPRGTKTLFPGGKEYHTYKDFMKYLATHTQNQINEKTHPYIFHMSWTDNKKNKKLYYEQMGEWYLSSSGDAKCLPQPDITCHYRDKPSSVYCGHVPPIDKGRASFWKDEKEVQTWKTKHSK